ncbi:MAG: hypothetical protein AAGI12_00460 [Pseudomonadota bacterium]
METILGHLQSYSPGILIGAGLALLIVPAWIRYIIAFGLIFLGVTQLYPDLLSGVAVPPTQQTGS